MASALESYYNCILSIPIETYGAWNEESLDYSKQIIELEYQAILTPLSKSGSQQTVIKDISGGVDLDNMLVKGRIVKPQTFDSRVHFPITAKVSLIREERKGMIELSLVPQSPYYQEAEILGEKFTGSLHYE